MKNVDVEIAKSGYWMYADGSSYWGVGLYKGNETPFEITKEMHQNKKTIIKEDGSEGFEPMMSLEQRQAWHKGEAEKKAIEKKKEEDAKSAKSAKAKSNKPEKTAKV